MDLRKVFFKNMEELAKTDGSVMVLVGDLGFSFCEDFAKKYPKQFINCGIAEQNMVGVAAGLALAGKKPYCYSGSIFLLSRANEFIRDDVAYNDLDVKLIGTGASGFLGFTHNFYAERGENFLKGFPNIVYIEAKNEERLKRALKLKGAMFIKL